jgi:DNA-binding MarR family transcriptional regulator
MQISSIVPVISLWEEFSLEHPAGDVQDFARWLIREKPRAETVRPGRKKDSSKTATTNDITEQGKVMLLIYRLHRFIEMKSKPVIKRIGFAKPHEFATLAEIYLLNKPNKKELAKKMLLEPSTTVEITKRLVQRGLIKEISDANDKRSTRLILTEKGMKKLDESYEGLQAVHDSFLDCLNERERAELLKLLEALEKFQSALAGE